MKYKSTRSDEVVSDTNALLTGLAPDGGLFVPTLFPYGAFDYTSLLGKSYQEVALWVLHRFFESFEPSELEDYITRAYNKHTFAADEIAPIHSLLEKVSVLELFHGRTQAFKDLALSIFPYLLTAAKAKEGETKDILILTATSGDTGKAALEGFADVEGTKIHVFYPTDGVSPIQKEQMQKQWGDNVNVTAIEGNFDDAQQTLKKIFNDEKIKQQLADKNWRLSSANSINIGRLVPQVAYYLHTYLELVDQGAIHHDEAFNVVVPSGNFGNILAAYWAKLLGVPIGKLICASNKNNVLTEFLQTGTYKIHRPFYTTITPSMDIVESSNLERYLYYVSGENSTQVADWMQRLEQEGVITLTKEELQRVQRDFVGCSLTDEDIEAVIEQVYNSYGYLMDPHTAVAMGAYMKNLQQHPEEGARHTVVVSTAHPFKFPDAVAAALDLQTGATPYETIEGILAVTGVMVPRQVRALEEKPLRFTKTIDKSEIAQAVLENV